MKLGCVLLAGGKGERFGERKQDIIFLDKPLWKHSYDTVLKLVEKENVVRVGIDIEGGKTRTMSVYNGLKNLPQDVERVLIVESARPLVTVKQLKQLAEDKHDSVSFVMPLVNTVIKRDGDYLNRNELYELLTPQAFNYKLLLKAFETEKYYDYTDDTRIMFEEYGIKPFFIETGTNLMKVTYQRDLPIIESIYNLMKKQKKE